MKNFAGVLKPVVCTIQQVGRQSVIPYDFLKLNFSHFSPQVRLFFVEKGNVKYLD